MTSRRTWIVALVIALAACSGGKKASGADRTAVKLQPYIACLNRHSERVLDAASHYVESTGGKPPTAAKGANLATVYDQDVPACVAGIAAAKARAPSLPALEAAGDAYAAALRAVMPLIVDLKTYYDRGNFKDDGAAHGIEVHPTIMAAFEAFAAANRKLGDEVSALNRANREADLAARAGKGGRKLDIILDETMLAAETLTDHGTPPWDQLDKLDATALAAEVDKVEKLVDELAARASGKPDEAKALGNVSALLSELKDYVTASKELLRRVRDKTPWSNGDKMNLGSDSEWMVNGSPGKLMRAYNRAVDAYNRL